MGAMDLDTLKKEDVESVSATIVTAAKVYGTPEYRDMSSACINQDLSWSEPAKKWESVLKKM